VRLARQWTSGLVLAGCLVWPRLSLAAQGGRTAPVSSGNAGAFSDLVLVSADTPQARAGPRSVTLVIVPVPRELPRDAAVTYEAIPAGDIQFLGQRTGQVSGVGVERIVVLTVRVPAHTPAGRVVAGRVRFFVHGAPRVDVVCTVDVPWVSGASMVLERRLLAARPGERVVLHYRLTNTGNAPDMIEVGVTTPERWGKGVLAVTSAFHLLGGETTAEGDIVLAIPRDAATGSTWLPLVARNAARDLAQTTALLEIVDRETQPAAGVRLTTSLATVLRQKMPATPFFGLDFQGALTPNVRAFGRLVQAVNARPADARGLSQVGMFPGASIVTFEGPRWRFRGGNTGEAFSEITGVNLWGSGATFAHDGTRWTTAAILAKPRRFSAPTLGNGYMAGAQVGRFVGGGMVHGTAVAADDPQSGRRLEALGIGGVAPPLGSGWDLSGEIAARRFRGGSGFGWLGEAKQQTPDRLLLVRYSHAPGGSSAFAPARDLLVATVSDGVTPTVRFGASVWGSGDVTPTVEQLHSAGWSAGPQWWVKPRTLLELELHGNGFDATSASGVIGSSEVLARLGAMRQSGSFLASASVAGGQVSRSLTPPNGARNEVVAGRWLVRGSVGHSTAAGAFEASASYEQNGAGSGLLPRQSVLAIRAAAVPLPVGLWGATGAASVQRYDWFGSRPGVTVVRAGFRVPLPASLAFTLEAEHNPLFVSAAAGGWNVAIKLEYATVVAWMGLRAAARGSVYEDRNGNGRRDSGEPGLAGVLVRRGGESVVTDAAGRYRFLTRADEPARLDETSLAFGLIAAFDSSRSPDLAVLPTAPVTIRLVPTSDSGQAAPPPARAGGSLVTVRVQARDQAGNIWSTRPDSQGVATLHALPPGSYQIELDLSGLQTPLILRGPLPSFTVEAGGTVPTMVIPLFLRPVRMFDPNNPSRNRNQSGRQ